MNRRRFLQQIGFGTAGTVWAPRLPSSGTTTAAETSARPPATGPLRVHPQNPRYFTDATGKAVYLTGSHTWSNLADMGPSDPPPPFDFDAYLAFLGRYGHNFIRLWAWELTAWDTKISGENKQHTVQPHPYARTGPGMALDGKPKFDLTMFDPAYFQRLRSRVEAAGRRGIFGFIRLMRARRVGRCVGDQIT